MADEPIFDRETIEYAAAQHPCAFCRGVVEPAGVYAAGGTQVYWRVRCRLCGRTMILTHTEDTDGE